MLLHGVLFLALAGATVSEPEVPVGITTLRVALYPYVPDAGNDDFRGFLKRLEDEFEDAHPGIDLHVAIPEWSEVDVYEPVAVVTALKDKRFDLMEIDMLLLPSIADTGAIAQVDAGLLPRGVHPAAVEASTYHGHLYGIPHLLCGNFVISRSPDVASADTSEELLVALSREPAATIDIVGDFAGSWTLSCLYLDSFADTRGPGRIPAPIPKTVDADVVSAFREIVLRGVHPDSVNGVIPSLDGHFDDNNNDALFFALGGADALIGFSERLHHVIKNDVVGSPLYVGSAALGKGNRPLLFTDSFVYRAEMERDVREAADAFVRYVNTPEVVEWMLFSDDVTEGVRVPRYLLPVSMELERRERFARDPYYPALFSEIRGAEPFPAEGLYMHRGELRDAVLEAIGR